MAMATCREGCGRPRREEGGRADPLCEECYRGLLERLADEFREEENAASWPAALPALQPSREAVPRRAGRGGVRRFAERLRVDGRAMNFPAFGPWVEGGEVNLSACVPVGAFLFSATFRFLLVVRPDCYRMTGRGSPARRPHYCRGSSVPTTCQR